VTRFSPDTRVRVVKDNLGPLGEWIGREGTVEPDDEVRASVLLDGMREALYFDDDELEAIPAEVAA